MSNKSKNVPYTDDDSTPESGSELELGESLDSILDQAQAASLAKESQDNAKIYSLYIKPSSRKRLGIAKKWLGLTYTETLDLMMGHLIQSEVLPEEAIKELKDAGLFRDEDRYGLELLGIQGRWKEAAKIVEDIKTLNTTISSQLEELIECVEDHAEAIIINQKY